MANKRTNYGMHVTLRKEMEFLDYTYLQDEIIEQIFSHLPARSIGQYRCLSKQWHTLLSSPYFIKTHITQTRARINQLPQPEESVFLFSGSGDLISFTWTNDQITLSVSPKKLSFASHQLHLNSETRCFGSCHGLVFIGNMNLKQNPKSFLINPTTQRIRELPSMPFAINPKACYYFPYGFGYDSVTDDCKIVAISHVFKSHRFKMLVHVYSVNNGAWKRCECTPFFSGHTLDPVTHGVFLERCVHWPAIRTTDSTIVIAAFNVVEEKFYEMPIMQSSTDNTISWDRYYLEVLGGRLCICNHSDSRLDVWMMKEYGVRESWTKLVTFESIGSLFSPLFLLGKAQENLVLKKYKEGTAKYEKLLTYNLHKNTFKDVVLLDGMAYNDFTLGKPFSETLVSPLGTDGNQMRRNDT